MNYFKATILLSSEQLMDDGSVDPDTYQDHGVVETITAPNLEELKSKLNRRYDLSKFEAVESDRLELSCNAIPELDMPKFVETYSIYLSFVQENQEFASLLKA